MRFFRNLKLQSKMLLLFSLVVLAGTFGIGMMANAINNMNVEMVDLGTQSGNLAEITTLQQQVIRQQKALSDYAATEEVVYLDEYVEARELARDALQRSLAAARYAQEAGAFEETDAERAPIDELALLEDVQADLTAYDAAVETHVLDLSIWVEGEPEEEFEMNPDPLVILTDPDEQERMARVEDNLEQIAYSYTLDLQDAAAYGDEITNNAIRFGVLVLVVFTALGVIAALATNSIADPVLNLTNAVVAFENDAYRPDMLARYHTRPDELGKLASAVDHMAQSITTEAQKQKQMLEAANRFVPVSYVDFLAKDDITQIQLGDHVSAQMPIMFTDIRSFSALSEKMTASENFQFINDYLKTISPAIREHNGALVKFVGDGMMSVFPFGVEDAVQAAVAQLEAVAAFNHERESQGLPATGLGIGLHVGPMMLGMVGDETRMQGDAFSDNVNLTSRIEGLNKFFGTNFIMSYEMLSSLENRDQFEVRKLGSVRVKGRQTPLEVFEVMSGDFTESDRLKVETRAAFEQALRLWNQGDFAQAYPLFEQVAAANPADVSAAYYRDESQRYMREGKLDDWDGVLVMVSK